MHLGLVFRESLYDKWVEFPAFGRVRGNSQEGGRIMRSLTDESGIERAKFFWIPEREGRREKAPAKQRAAAGQGGPWALIFSKIITPF